MNHERDCGDDPDRAGEEICDTMSHDLSLTRDIIEIDCCNAKAVEKPPRLRYD